eukprot:7384901-Prymnesium_polylepis.2
MRVRQFFMPLLEDGRHVVYVSKVADIIPAMERLRANATLARRIAHAGRRFALTQARHAPP